MSRTGTLSVRGLAKSYGSLHVLDRVDIDVSSGQTLALLGPSGCGKSTILRLLAGFETADAGSLVLDGAPLCGPSPQRGMVAQAGTLFPWLSVRQNIAFGPRESGATDAERSVNELLAVTGLREFANALPRQLSGGMRQRAAIAQVLVNRPPVLLLDEPFGALDAQTRLHMHEWFRGLLAERPTTTVLVTHDVEEALLLGDRIGLLSVRPARITEQLSVPFGPRRGRHTLAEAAFGALKARVVDAVLAA